MKNKFATLIISLIVVVFKTAAQDSYSVNNNFQMIINGTSNVHNWEENVNNISGQCRLLWNNDGTFNILSMTLIVETKAIKSSHGSLMDNKTYDALKADANPTITFQLTNPINNVRPNSTIYATAILKIAGISKPVKMEVKASGDNSAVTFEGSQVVNMRDFGVAPPTAFMGAMKVGDNVTINFKTGFSKSKISSQLP